VKIALDNIAQILRKITGLLEELEEAYFTARQSALALFVNLGNLLAGLSISSALEQLRTHPWVFRIYPQVLGTRGILTGIFSARTSTGLHLGSINSSLRRNTRYFYSLVSTMLVLASLSALMIYILFSISTLYISVDIYTVVYTTIAAVSPFSLFFISFIAFQVFRKKLDPDILLYPSSSVLNDVIISLVFVGVVRAIILQATTFLLALTVVFMALFSALGFYIFYYGQKDVFLTTLKEGGLALFIGLSIELGTGIVLNELLKAGGIAKIAILYPVMLSVLGSSTSIIGSMLTTRISTGEFDFSISSLKRFSQNILGLQAASVTFHGALSIIASILVEDFSCLEFFALSYLSHILGFIVMIPVVFLTAYITYRKGLDPDNFINPIQSSIADLVETISILVVAKSILR